MNNSKLQQTQRTALTHLIADIINLPVFKKRESRILAFACIYVRMVSKKNQLALMTALATSTLNKQKNDQAVYAKVVRCNQIIHAMTDSDGNYIFDQTTGLLSDIWELDLADIAVAMQSSIPESFMPTSKHFCLISSATNIPSSTTPSRLK